MKWFAISGSWRLTNELVKKDVESAVSKIIINGNGIITGGALGVDYLATSVVLKKGNPKNQLKILLPIKFELMIKHLINRAAEKVITKEQALMIKQQYNEVIKKEGLILDEWGFTKANEESYYARNTKIIELCDELYAFQVNESKGTQDAINKALELGKKVHLKKYYIKTQ